MNLNKVKRWSIWYAILKLMARIALPIFYRKVEVIGARNIPQNEALVIAPNHHNAFADPIIAAAYLPSGVQAVFLTRGDVFKQSWVANIFFALKMLPVFRARDKVNVLEANNATFDTCRQVLQQKGCVLLFPEANQIMWKHLQPLSKGLARIAFGALNEQQQQERTLIKDVRVVPVSLYFSHIANFRAKLRVCYGPSISVAEYQTRYNNSNSKAMRQFTNTLQISIISEMVHIDSLKYYKQLASLHQFLNVQYNGFIKRYQYKHEKIHANAINKMVELGSLTILNNIYEQNKTTIEQAVRLQGWRETGTVPIIAGFVIFTAAFLLVLLAALLNTIPLLLTYLLNEKVIRNKKFVASIKIATIILIAPIYWVLVLLCLLMLINSGYKFTLISLALVLLHIVALPAYDFCLKYIAAVRRWWYYLHHKTFASHCTALYQDLCSILSTD